MDIYLGSHLGQVFPGISRSVQNVHQEQCPMRDVSALKVCLEFRMDYSGMVNLIMYLPVLAQATLGVCNSTVSAARKRCQAEGVTSD